MGMSTFKAYFKKEYIESLRQYRYVILAVGIIGFAILDPVMLKLLPKLVGDKLPGDISALMIFTPKRAINNYIKDLTQISVMVIAFVLGGVLSEERTSEKFVFPYSKGGSPMSIVLAKCIYYTIMISLFVLLGFIIAYYYAGILFKGETVGIMEILKSTLLISVYFFFIISLVMFLSSMVKRGTASGFIALIIIFILNSLSGVKSIGKFLPGRLVAKANLFTLNESGLAVALAILCGITFVMLAVIRMKRSEVI